MSSVVERVTSVLSQPEFPSNDRVARQFNRAADSYDSHCELQLEVGKRLLDSTSNWVASSPVVMELGCGTGRFLALLLEAGTPDTLLGVDIAPEPLKLAKNRLPHEVILLNADFDSVPIERHSADLVLANMSLQWSANLEGTLANCFNYLKPGGVLGFSLPDSGSFGSLRQLCRMANTPDFLNQFPSPSELMQSLECWQILGMDDKYYRQHHPDILSLLKGFKSIGGSAKTGTDQRPLKRRHIRNLQSRIAAEGIDLDWSITTVIAQKPA